MAVEGKERPTLTSFAPPKPKENVLAFYPLLIHATRTRSPFKLLFKYPSTTHKAKRAVNMGYYEIDKWGGVTGTMRRWS